MAPKLDKPINVRLNVSFLVSSSLHHIKTAVLSNNKIRIIKTTTIKIQILLSSVLAGTPLLDTYKTTFWCKTATKIYASFPPLFFSIFKSIGFSIQK